MPCLQACAHTYKGIVSVKHSDSIKAWNIGVQGTCIAKHKVGVV